MNNELLEELHWRLADIKEMLMSRGVGGERLYGCDEWSVPVQNINSALSKIKEALDT